MTWGFHERLAVSKGGDAMAEEILREYFNKVEDFKFDPSAADKPYEHDFNIIAHGQLYKVEHKHRPRRDWGDELLEDVSNDVSGRPGWTWRAGESDYVLFTYPTSQRWTIWPGPELEAAWRKNRDTWAKRYGIKAALNPGYRTLNVPVPTVVLMEALIEAGAPRCMTCGRNVGKFRAKCSECGSLNCCAVSEGEWICGRCAW